MHARHPSDSSSMCAVLGEKVDNVSTSLGFGQKSTKYVFCYGLQSSKDLAIQYCMLTGQCTSTVLERDLIKPPSMPHPIGFNHGCLNLLCQPPMPRTLTTAATFDYLRTPTPGMLAHIPRADGPVQYYWKGVRHNRHRCLNLLGQPSVPPPDASDVSASSSPDGQRFRLFVKRRL